ncbi:c-type cytochrome [Rhodovarius crocodyli]|uniref:C-type cytochrome n=2 Tax=Rhodovarius crocodyli TaxID=1979269 RepID=A0A437M2Q5_9PROT|nr:c-type cytochrome [Rhodovarius crocodyli]
MKKAALAALLALGCATGASAQEAAAEGRRLFQQRCASCHATETGINRIGPSLAGVTGRQAGRLEGARITEALRGSGLTWDEATLDRFLQAPRQLVPGTSMMVALSNPAQRAAVLAYLATLR